MKTTTLLCAALGLTACGIGRNPAVSTAKAAPSDALAATGIPAVTSAPVAGGPGNGSCADSQAELVYTRWRYEGGAAPAPGMLVGEQKLVYKGAGAGDTRYFEGRPQADSQQWTLALRFVDGTKQVLQSLGNREAGSETYALKLEVTMLQGLGPTIGSHLFETFVVCTDSWNYLLP